MTEKCKNMCSSEARLNLLYGRLAPAVRYSKYQSCMKKCEKEKAGDSTYFKQLTAYNVLGLLIKHLTVLKTNYKSYD